MPIVVVPELLWYAVSLPVGACSTLVLPRLGAVADVSLTKFEFED
jgi:hypothetical protein